MTAQRKAKAADRGVLARNLGTNTYRFRVLVVPKPSQQALARFSGLADETVRKVENSRDPAQPAYNASLEVAEKLATGFTKLGVNVTAIDLLATPSKATGRRDHLSVVPSTGEALPLRG
jgi:DNA-binding XRE family transcriptional regulator